MCVCLSTNLQSVAQRLAEPPAAIAGALEGTDEYHLIVRANNAAVEIDTELMVLHKVRCWPL